MELRLEEIRELCRQFSALHDGQLPPDEIAALEAMLRDNPAARRLYVRYARVCAGLSWDTAHSTDPLSANQFLSAAAPTKKRAGAVAFVTDLTQTMFGMFSRPGLFSLGIAAVIGAVLSAGIVLMFLSTSPTARPQLTALSEPASVPEVRSLKLESGAVTLTLANIGHVIVEGPAEFNLLGPKRAQLAYGRLKMRVTEETGHGFVVETPGGEVIDLGTEFGLDVDRAGKTSLAVFEGMVNMRIPSIKPEDEARLELFEIGEGAVIGREGQVGRLMSVVTGNSATFRQEADDSDAEPPRIISQVTDNLQSGNTKKFYQIVPHGLNEDVLAYVDRLETQWNGATGSGMPAYLQGADYVKTFNADKMRDNVKIRVRLSRPARLFVFFDDRLDPPQWLTKGFRRTKDKLGLDFGPYGRNTYHYAAGKGPGVSIDTTYSIWERIVTKPGTVTLGHNPGESVHTSSMYGIAAVPLIEPHPEAGKVSTEEKMEPSAGPKVNKSTNDAST